MSQENLQQRMARLLGEGEPAADDGQLLDAAMLASEALESWKDAGRPDDTEDSPHE